MNAWENEQEWTHHTNVAPFVTSNSLQKPFGTVILRQYSRLVFI